MKIIHIGSLNAIAQRAAVCAVAAALLAGCAVRPEPMTHDAHVLRARQDIGRLLYKSRPVEGELTLADVVARGLTDNLDHRLALMEETLQRTRLDIVSYDMLPSLAVNAGYNWRNKVSASESESLLTGTQSLEPSFSSERATANADLSFSWNLLDFGLGYFQAKQQADEVPIAIEVRRRTLNNTTREIISAYYRALYAQRLLPKVEKALARAEKAVAASDTLRREQLVPAQQMLSYKRDLLQSVLALRNLVSELSRARQELATLINVPVDENFRLADAKPVKLPAIRQDIRQLQNRALVYRAELREEAYKERIDRNAVHKETLKMFPVLSAISSVNTDSNNYLYYNNWAELSMRAAWNLLDVAKAAKTRKMAEMQVEYAQMRRLALTSAILAQTAISYYQYDEARNNHTTAATLADVENGLLKAARDSEAAQTGSRLESVRQEVASLTAAISAGRSYAEAQTALAGLLVSTGYDLVPASTATENVAALSAALAPRLSDLQKGEFPDADAVEPVLEQPVLPLAQKTGTSKEEGGFFGWLKGLFGSNKVPAPAPAPAAAVAQDVVKPAVADTAALREEILLPQRKPEKFMSQAAVVPAAVKEDIRWEKPAAAAKPVAEKKPAAIKIAEPVVEKPATPAVDKKDIRWEKEQPVKAKAVEEAAAAEKAAASAEKPAAPAQASAPVIDKKDIQWQETPKTAPPPAPVVKTKAEPKVEPVKVEAAPAGNAQTFVLPPRAEAASAPAPVSAQEVVPVRTPAPVHTPRKPKPAAPQKLPDASELDAPAMLWVKTAKPDDGRAVWDPSQKVQGVEGSLLPSLPEYTDGKCAIPPCEKAGP